MIDYRFIHLWQRTRRFLQVSTMSIVNSRSSRLLVYFALMLNASIAHETTTKIADYFEKSVISSSSTILPKVGVFTEISIVPIKSRILERTTYLKPEKISRRTDNSTLFVTIGNDAKEEAVSTTRRPLSLGDFSTLSKTSDFKPSFHLGEIRDIESRKSNVHHPFNKVQRVKFDNTVRIDGESTPDTDRVRAPGSSLFHDDDDDDDATIATAREKKPAKIFDTDNRYGLAVPIEIVHQQQEFFLPQQVQLQTHEQQIGQPNIDGDDNENIGDKNHHYHYHNNEQGIPVGHESHVTFEYPRSPAYVTVTAKPMTLTRPVYPSTLADSQTMHHAPYHYQPAVDNVHTIFVKPSKFHDQLVNPTRPTEIQIQHYEYAAPASGEAIDKPEIHNYHHDHHIPGITYQQVAHHDHDIGNAGKPDTVLYLTSHRETAFTRMRKFPYKFYEPNVLGQQDGQFHFVQEEHPHHPKEMRVSPWKKIIHLIGAFLPLGLLLATLKPNVVKIENTTQPNIVLSKLRVVDLPAEHKRARLVDERPDENRQDTCDDRSICEMIVSGSEPNSNLLQNILWNLTTRSTDEEAQKHGLHEIFAAAKRKDCSTIDC